MNQSALRLYVRSLIAEAKEKKAIKKSKHNASVENRLKMIDEAGDKAALQAKINKIDEDIKEAHEIKNAIPANMNHFVDPEIIGDLHDDLAKSIEELEAKKAELEEQMKGMEGVKESAPKKKSLEEASYKTFANSKEAQYLKKGDIITSGDEVISVSAGAKTPSGKVEVTLKTKDGKTKTSTWGKTTKVGVKKDIEEARFEKGKDVGEKGKNFAKIAKSASKRYGSKEAGQKVAGAILKKVVAKEGLDTKKVYGGTGQNQGATGSSLQFTVSENTPEYFEIDYTLTPNSKHRPAGAGSRSAREKEYGYAKISKKDFNGQITVKGENFNIGKDFITNNL